MLIIAIGISMLRARDKRNERKREGGIDVKVLEI